jgi:flagellar motor protein MotB
VPIYQVTVVERTVKAVNYQYRNGPTRIDFRGTVLLPHAKGEATVESKAGRTDIAAKFEKVQPATRFGHEYLTYVLWAITPEGHAKNLGEMLADSSNHAHLQVTTDFQTFGLIVTAEPYAAVRQPSNVVVLENEVRPDTLGHSELIQAKYELLPRGHYTYNVPKDITEAEGNGQKLSMDRYEALLEVYQAQNAVQIARSQGADRYAADTFSKAEDSLRQAKEFYDRKVDRSTVVSAARAAAQTAEDARTIAAQRKHDEELATAKSDTAREQQLRLQAEAEAQRARSQAAADRAQLEQERSGRQGSGLETASVRTQAPPPPPPPQTVVVETPVSAVDPAKTEFRVQLLRQLMAALPARDTPRGLVVTLPDTDFRGPALEGGAASSLARIASVVAAHGGLTVAVEGHGDRFSSERAAVVRDALMRDGVPPGALSAQGFGNSRPLGPGREENRRVEIVIAGEPIGNSASWDRSYQVIPK